MKTISKPDYLGQLIAADGVNYLNEILTARAAWVPLCLASLVQNAAISLGIPVGVGAGDSGNKAIVLYLDK